MAKVNIILKGINLDRLIASNKQTQIAAIEQEVNESAKFLLNRYDEITAPFETNFEFEVVKTGEWEYNIRPKNYDIERTTGSSGTVNSWVLFNTLDLGSENAKRVLLPNDFENETSPNSTSTRSAGYDRKGIFAFFNKDGKDMEPRNWSLFLINEYINKYLGSNSLLEKNIANALRKASGLA